MDIPVTHKLWNTMKKLNKIYNLFDSSFTTLLKFYYVQEPFNSSTQWFDSRPGTNTFGTSSHTWLVGIYVD